jgi:Fur family ferric uptake transcriptional regulator
MNPPSGQHRRPGAVDKVHDWILYIEMRTDPTQLLHDHGLQVTPQRLAILDVVAEIPHSTADAVTEAVRARLGTISRQAVYNTLGTLVDRGLLRRIQPIGSPALYEDRVGDNHHHLICRECGEVIDVDCAVGEAPCLTPDDDRGYLIDEAQVTYRGICPACQARNQSSAGSTAKDDDGPSSQRAG